MSSAARRHRRALFLRSLVALPILALLLYRFWEVERAATRRAVPDGTPWLVNALVASLYLAMALMTIDKRPGSLPSRLLYRLFVLLALELSLPPVRSLAGAHPLAPISTDVLTHLVDGLLFGTELHLVSLIPRRPAWLRRHGWVVPLYYSAGLFLGVLASVSLVAEEVSGRTFLPTHRSIMEFASHEWMIVWSSLAAGILIVGMVSHPRARGRAQAAFVLSGVLPWTLYVYASRFLDQAGRPIPLAVDAYLGLLALLPYPVSIFVMLRRQDAAKNRMLRNLIEDVQEAGSIEKISRLISEKLNLAFSTKCDYVFFRESRESAFTPTHASGSELGGDEIPSDYRILAMADRSGDALAYPDDLAEELPAAEVEWLDDLRANLIVPIVESEGHMMGLLVLGQKRSEEPYTPDDLELLRALAGQIALAHENLALQLEVRKRELVQRRILDRLEGEKADLVKECPACGFCFDVGEETCPRDGAELTLNLPVERLVDGHYRLEQVLGRGGASVVYLATDVRLDRGVAVKVLSLSLLDNVMAPRRFEREARVSAQLLHPNIVTTHDFGKTRNGLPYLVMEYLEGQPLSRLLKRSGPLAGEVAADWLSQVLDGLGAAHALGVVHRDLKPDNVFIVQGLEVGEDASVKILDFGLAKIAAASRKDDITSPGTIMGTLAYMAPEQLSGGRGADARTDLYSVGVIAYEAVTGRRPFEGCSPPQVLTSILKGEFELPDEPGVGDLRAVLERCFDRRPERRHGSAAALKKELVPALKSCPRLGSVKAA